MPNITLIRAHLFEAIGRVYSDKEFDELCFEFGVEVDDVMTEVVEACNISLIKSIFLHLELLFNRPSHHYPNLCSLPRMAVKRSTWFTSSQFQPTDTTYSAWRVLIALFVSFST